MGKLIYRIPGSRLLISSLPGSALRMLVELLGKPRDVNSVLKALPGKLDIKIHLPSILYVFQQRSRSFIVSLIYLRLRSCFQGDIIPAV